MIDFLLGCSLWYTSCLKLRGIVTQKLDRATLSSLFSSQRHRKREMRATEKLCTWNWPGAFELRTNFNWDKLTSWISGQSPKRYPKWRCPMTIFLLLWRGISLGSDALWKLLVSTKNIRFLEWPSPLKEHNLVNAHSPYFDFPTGCRKFKTREVISNL